MAYGDSTTAAPGAQPTGVQLASMAEATSDRALPFAAFKVRHPSYDAEYWRVCDALYAGGRKLLGDVPLLKHVFPAHGAERADIYEERRKRAFYVPYAGAIVDHLVAGLCTRPIEMAAEPKADPWYDLFLLDVSPPGGRRMTWGEFLKGQMLTALRKRRAWALVDLPSTAELLEGVPAPASRADEERAGLFPYVLPLDPESVIDWEEDDSGELLWALLCTETARRGSLASARDEATLTFTLWTREGWERWSISFKRSQPPLDQTPVPLVGEGTHPFGRVPIVRLDLPDGLWAMAKLEGLAREHFNKRAALAWAEYKSLLPDRYEFLGPEDPAMNVPAPANQMDPDRAVTQVRGQGYTQIRGAGDRAEFIGPDSAPFEIALKSCNDIRDEMHRVTHSMALSVDNSAAALGRSAESKQVDQASTAVVLGALGRILREHAEDVMSLVSAGREDVVEWSASGADKFSSLSVGEAIKEALDLESIEVPSSTFRKRQKYQLAKAVLGDEATDEDLKAIEEELDEGVTAEAEIPVPPDAKIDMGDGDEDEPIEDDGEPPPSRRKGFSTRPGMNGS